MATQIVSVDETGELILDKDAVESLLGKYHEKKLRIVSCVGALRGGKSTFLSWLVRKAAFGDGDAEKSTVFPTAWGRIPCTSGIWAQIVESPAGDDDDDTCWLFLDTQGMFDGKLDLTSTGHLFGLTALISSLLIYNVSKRVGEDIISHAAHFAVLARAARPLQAEEIRCLEFLVRDWEYFEFPDDISDDLMKEQVLNDSEEYKFQVLGKKGQDELDQTRKSLEDSFTSISVALLPHPGRAVTRPDFLEHQTEKMDDTFRSLFFSYCDSILQRTKDMTSTTKAKATLFHAREIYLILNEACKHFREHSPRLESLFVSTSRARNIFAEERARMAFDDNFKLNPENFHESYNRALDIFDSLAKFGPEELREEFRNRFITYAETTMNNIVKVQQQVKLRRRRIKQAVVATSAGVVLSPLWVPSAVSFVARSSIVAVTTTASTIAGDQVTTSIIVLTISALATVGAIAGTTYLAHKTRRQGTNKGDKEHLD